MNLHKTSNPLDVDWLEVALIPLIDLAWITRLRIVCLLVICRLTPSDHPHIDPRCCR